MKKAEPTQEMKLMRIAARIRSVAEDLVEPDNERQAADPKYYADKLKKAAIDIEQYVAGSGTGAS